MIRKLNVKVVAFFCTFFLALLSHGCNDNHSTSQPAEDTNESSSTLTLSSNEVVPENYANPDAIVALLARGSNKDQFNFSLPEQPKQVSSTFAAFSNEIVLESYASAEAGGHTILELTWRGVFTNPNENYFVFIHVLGEKDKILFQFDHQLFNAAGKPTTQWDQTPVKDVFQITPPAGHPSGKYTLRLGVWVPQTKRVLPVSGTNLPRPVGDYKLYAVLLNEIECR